MSYIREATAVPLATAGGVQENITANLTRTLNNQTEYVLNGSGDLHYHDVFHDVFDDFKNSLYTYDQPKNIVLMSIYSVVFLLSFFGNILVILVIIANRSMRSVTNYFLLNLAVADLLVTFVCIPLTMGEMVYKAWIYGLVLCKATGFLQGVSIAASVLTIMGLALDRYLALSHPVKARRISTPEHARKVLVFIWLVAGGIMVPLVFVRHLAIHPLDPARTLGFCHERWPSSSDRRAYDLFLFVFIYVVPGGVVTASYAFTGCSLLTDNHLIHRQNSDSSHSCRIIAGRRRVARMLLGLAGLFACSWLPYHIVSLYLDFQDEQATDSQSLAALSFALLLGHSHSAQNPILYCIMNSSLKRAMMSLLICRRLQGHSPRCATNSKGNSTLAQRKDCSVRGSVRRQTANGSVTQKQAIQVKLDTNRLSPHLSTSSKTEVPLTHEMTPILSRNPEQETPAIQLRAIYMDKGRFRTRVDYDLRSGGDDKDLIASTNSTV